MQSAFKMKKVISIQTNYTFREKLIIALFDLSKNIYRVTIKRYTKNWNTSIAQLANYNDGTLGKDLALFLEAHNFNLEPKFEKHDIYHFLTDYPTTVVGEICLSTFNVGNGKRSIYTVGVAMVGVLIMIDNYSVFKKAYFRGKNARSYVKWDFQHLLNEQTINLKALLFKQEIKNKEIII